MSDHESAHALHTPANASRAEYVARINRVIDYIEANLSEPLNLAHLADIAHFSRFHFHRIFGAMIGETVNAFVQRLRVEKAANMLCVVPEIAVTTIAMECGFGSPASFARAFKQAFGVSATKWREGLRGGALAEGSALSKIRQHLRNPGNAENAFTSYFVSGADKPTWKYDMPNAHPSLRATIEVREEPKYHVVYLRHVGPYGQANVVRRLFERLRNWTAARDLLSADSKFICVAHDNPMMTHESKLRLSVCISVPADVKGDAEVGTMEIAGGRYAVGHFEIFPQQIAEAWQALIRDWLPDSGLAPDDRLCYEIVRNRPDEDPEGKIHLDICVPVRPL